MKTLGQIAHEKGEEIGAWSRQWAHMGQSQRDEWEAIALAVVTAAKIEAADVCREIGLKHQQTEGTYAAGQKAGAFECADALVQSMATTTESGSKS